MKKLTKKIINFFLLTFTVILVLFNQKVFALEDNSIDNNFESEKSVDELCKSLTTEGFECKAIGGEGGTTPPRWVNPDWQSKDALFYDLLEENPEMSDADIAQLVESINFSHEHLSFGAELIFGGEGGN